VLALTAIASLMVALDTLLVSTALTTIRLDLGASLEALEWTVNAYNLSLAVLLMPAAALGDRFGRRRMFAAGLGLFVAASAACALSTDAGTLIAARAVQGAGAALIAPAALTLLLTMFMGEPRELTRALALYGAAAPAGGTAGVFLGGVITEWVSWPWVFYINIPIALLVLAVIPSLMPSAPTRRGTIDLAGAATVTAGLGLAVFGIVRAPEEGWGSNVTILSLAGAVVLLAAFTLIQRSRTEPLMRLAILRTPNLSAANVAQVLLGAAWIPMWFFLNLYLQQVLGFGAFAGGSALLPMTVTIMVLMILVAPRVIGRFGFKAPIVAGLWLLALGLVGLSFARPDGNFAADVLPASLIAATGMALAFIPSLGTAISSAPPEEGGLAAGIVNTSYQVGSALGLAAMTALAAARGADQLGDRQALTDGFSAAFLGAAALAALGGVLALITLRQPQPSPQASPEPELTPIEEAL